jgi:hypothetical protein
MAFKSGLVSYLFGLVKGAAEHGPAMADRAAVSGTVSLVYPLAILAAPLIDMAAEHIRDAKDPHDLAELYRESMRGSFPTGACQRPPSLRVQQDPSEETR